MTIIFDGGWALFGNRAFGNEGQGHRPLSVSRTGIISLAQGCWILCLFIVENLQYNRDLRSDALRSEFEGRRTVGVQRVVVEEGFFRET